MFFSLQNYTLENQVGLRGYSMFYNRYFKKNINMVEKEKYLEIIEKDEYKNMVIDEVKIIDGTIVDKISNNVLYN